VRTQHTSPQLISQQEAGDLSHSLSSFDSLEASDSACYVSIEDDTSCSSESDNSLDLIENVMDAIEGHYTYVQPTHTLRPFTSQ
jgi:hypothetical protein